MASSRGMPVISSAARLKIVIRHSASTVKTPSEMLSSTASVGVWARGLRLWGLRFMIRLRVAERGSVGDAVSSYRRERGHVIPFCTG